ncbi:DUF948 domain-containing protein [Alkalibaculum sporogenes]|uniref:DUF948 domain-containing protein n=1 Tax=Alkalibaculum sporogenes TaxID=2655001 RepID=UPI00128C72F7
MFAQIHLWEVGILFIGIAFIVGAIYIAKTMKNLAKTIEDMDELMLSNKQNIDAIIADIEVITKSSSGVMEDVQESVGSLKHSVLNVEKTVTTTKNFMLKPVLKTLNYSHFILKIIKKFTKKSKSKV